VEKPDLSECVATFDKEAKKNPVSSLSNVSINLVFKRLQCSELHIIHYKTLK